MDPSMNQTFQPRACAPDQWKTWLRDGGSLFRRAFPSWGIIWGAIYILLGCAIHTWALLFIIVAALSGVFQMLQQVIMAQMMSGHSGISETTLVVKTFVQEQRSLLIQSIAFRTLGVIVGVAIMALFLFSHHGLATPKAPPSGWEKWISLMDGLYNCVIFPIIVQMGGCISAILALRRHGVPLGMARKLNAQGYLYNLKSQLILGLTFLVASFVCITLPILIPFLTLYWMGVMECYYADVFQGGYGIKAVVRSHSYAGGLQGALQARWPVKFLARLLTHARRQHAVNIR
jgi:hypothetical protein